MLSFRSCFAVLSVIGVALVFAAGWHLGRSGSDVSPVSQAEAAGGVVPGPNTVSPDRYAYYPGTEVLGEDEIRVVNCGSGMPDARRGQAAACWLVETGNGEKFIFDIGTGSMRNITSLMIPYEYLTKVFLTHLHTDHWGDLASLWAGGWTSGRPVPLEIWGPAGSNPKMGTKWAVERFLEAFNWDKVTREFAINPVPGQIKVHEFDYKPENHVVYQENGVTIRSWPAIHLADGPVSYTLEYAGLKIVLGGDTAPNKWFVKYAKGADFAIHEAFMTPDTFVTWYNQPPQLAWRACCAFHTSPEAFGKVMSQVKPRHAVAYHFNNEEATRYQLFQGIRQTYDGPLSMATDMMVWNVTKDKITERMGVSADNSWAVPGTVKQGPPVAGQPDPMSGFLKAGLWAPAYEAQNDMLDTYMKKYKLEKQNWRDKSGLPKK